MADTPAAEIDVDAPLVRRLLAEQHPDLADRSIVPLANGWDNVLFRLGADLVVRIPRRRAAVDLVDHEIACLPRIAPLVDLVVPTPLRVGEPSSEVPWRWTIVPWVDGTVAAAEPVSARAAWPRGDHGVAADRRRRAAARGTSRGMEATRADPGPLRSARLGAR